MQINLKVENKDRSQLCTIKYNKLGSFYTMILLDSSALSISFKNVKDIPVLINILTMLNVNQFSLIIMTTELIERITGILEDKMNDSKEHHLEIRI